jgi:serine/threonine protein kinase
VTDADRRRRVDDLCDAALDCEPRERAAFVATACGDDDALRAEVESLLVYAASSERFLSTPLGAVAAHVLTPENEASLVGRKVGSLEILTLLGAGGMGDVYHARDTTLGRNVAIKVVSSAFLSVPDRLARFEREARVLATLNHPHIGAIYGVEEADGVRALVLELVEGATLAERVETGPLPFHEALEIGRQIADALEAAHEKGVIHCDLKPPNIKITPDGTVKVLDFGLAKVRALEDSTIEGPPCVAPDHSREGVIAGTTSYMSPEQARGKPVDKRTDIWSFGCVLYEMLTGRPAFAGETASDTIAAIIEREPDWSRLAPQTNQGIRRLLGRCLAKDLKHRLRDVGDARLEIEEALSAPANGPRENRRQRTGVARLTWLAAGTALLVAAAAALQLWRSEYFWRNPLEDATVTRLTDSVGAEHHAAISRDGKFVVFLSDRDGPWDAWVSQVGTGDFHNLTNGKIAELRNPATRTLGFSPDGSNVTLWSRVPDSEGGGVVYAGWAVPTLGGALRPFLIGIQDISELDWSPDGTRLVHHPPTPGDPLFVTDLDEKSVPRQIHVARKGFHNHFPLWSRDGAFVYFVHGLPLEKSDIWRIRAEGGEPERLTYHDARVSFPTWLDRRTLLYLTTDDEGYGPSIYAMDVERRTPHRVFAGVDSYTSLAASEDGRQLVATVSRTTSSVWRAPIADHVVDESGATPLALPTPGPLSPRVRRGYIAYRGRKAGRDGLWKLPDGSAPIELWNGANGRVVAGPAISSAGRMAFVVRKDGRQRVFVIDADGAAPRVVAEQLDVRGTPAWSPDGQWLAVAAANDDGIPKLHKIPLNEGAPVQLVKEYSTDPVWAPSGAFLIYSGPDVGTTFPVKAVRSDGGPFPLRNLILTRGARRMALLGDDTLIVMKGNISRKDFWSIDLRSGHERQMTSLRQGSTIGDFDISADGREIFFDRSREESDIVLFHLRER